MYCYSHTVADKIILHNKTCIIAAQKNMAEKANNLKPLVLSYMHFCIFVFNIYYSISYYTPQLWFPNRQAWS